MGVYAQVSNDPCKETTVAGLCPKSTHSYYPATAPWTGLIVRGLVPWCSFAAREMTRREGRYGDYRIPSRQETDPVAREE